MSIQIIKKAWTLKLKPTEMLVLQALADHADENGGSVYPGVDLIAWKTGLSRRGVQKTLRRLEEIKVILDVHPERKKVGGYENSTEYQIQIDKGEPKAPLQKRRTVFAVSKGQTANGETEKGERYSEKGERRDVKWRTVFARTVSNREKPPTGALEMLEALSG